MRQPTLQAQAKQTEVGFVLGYLASSKNRLGLKNIVFYFKNSILIRDQARKSYLKLQLIKPDPSSLRSFYLSAAF